MNGNSLRARKAYLLSISLLLKIVRMETFGLEQKKVQSERMGKSSTIVLVVDG